MTQDGAPCEFFVAGGTLHPDAPSYVRRPADEELLHLALAGDFCYVLTTRQMGKSSLMIRTARLLQARDVKTAIVDLTLIGTDVSAERWYKGFLFQLLRQLRLRANLEAEWQSHADLPLVERFVFFLRDEILNRVPQPIVIFIDEIDRTLTFDFRDDFFAAIRAMYNDRARDAAFRRLSFVLLGVVSPPELIEAPELTPFNIGRGLCLDEFTRDDAAVLQDGLEAIYPGEGEAIFSRIFYWTEGHPYLTQKLCLEAAESGKGSWSTAQVDKLVEQEFLLEGTRKETNLQFVQDRILNSPRRSRLLSLYHKVLRGKNVPTDGQSRLQNELRLTGLIDGEDGYLRVRNAIYRRAFDEDWVRKHTPTNWVAMIASVAVFVALVALFILGYNMAHEYSLNKCEGLLNGPPNPDAQISCLAWALRLPSILGTADWKKRAIELVDQRDVEELVALFKVHEAKSADLEVVVHGLSPTLAYVDLTRNTAPVLEAMAGALPGVDGTDQAADLQRAITAWLSGRESYLAGDYQDARSCYDMAIDLNDRNPALFYERARVCSELGDHEQALLDMEETLILVGGPDGTLGKTDVSKALRRLVQTSPGLVVALGASPPADLPNLGEVYSELVPEPGLGFAAHILFVSDRDGDPEIYQLEQALEVPGRFDPRLVRMTHHSNADTEPAPSRDGGYVAFVSERDGDPEIYTMDANGKGLTQLTNNQARDTHPSWSPDGARILFQSDRDGNLEIYTMNSDGSEPVRLTHNQARDLDPVWSSDGERIAFVSHRDANFEIYVMDADGNRQLNLSSSPDATDSAPVWSPDGSHIAYVSVGAEPAEIYVVNVEGGEPTRLTDNKYDDRQMSWSPDGQRLAFVSDRDGNDEIYIMNVNGSGVKRLTRNTFEDGEPVWSRDGGRILFWSCRGIAQDIYLMNENGDWLVSLTRHPAGYENVQWWP